MLKRYALYRADGGKKPASFKCNRESAETLTDEKIGIASSPSALNMEERQVRPWPTKIVFDLFKFLRLNNWIKLGEVAMAMMAENGKTRTPCAANSIPRERLFAQLDATGNHAPVVWLATPAGSGKTLLLASYVEHRCRPCLWYQLDPTDSEPALFFKHLAAAACSLAGNREPLPSFTLENPQNLPAFSRSFFIALLNMIPAAGLLIFDDYHETPKNSPLHAIFRYGLTALPRRRES